MLNSSSLSAGITQTMLLTQALTCLPSSSDTALAHLPCNSVGVHVTHLQTPQMHGRRLGLPSLREEQTSFPSSEVTLTS